MGVTISLILAIITLIFNLIKKNRIGVNLLSITAVIILTGITVAFSMQTASFYILNTVYTALALLLSVLAILLIIKNLKTIKWTKSILLIPIVLAYVFIHVLTNTNNNMNFTVYENIKELSIFTLGIALLVIFQINLFINLISNNDHTKKESDKKIKKEKVEK